MGGGRRLVAAAPRRAAAAAAALLLAACTATVPGTGRRLGTAIGPPPPASTSQPVPAADCPDRYVPPDPRRPRVRLAFDLASDLATVRGTEHIEFTPDLPIGELVFRLTANTAPTVATGNRIVVTAATAHPGGGTYTFSAAGADPSTQGGLLRIPFASQIPAGTTVTADLAFTLTLGDGSFDRFGRADAAGGRYAWFGSAQPLLSWERGYGWHAEDMLQFTAESATSEAMDTELTVSAPAADTVLMSGDPGPGAAHGATRTWHSAVAAVRDVSVAVGPFVVRDASVGGVALRVGAPDAAGADRLLPEFERAITQLSRQFGPFPFPSLSVARLPASGGGIEYPSSILMLDGSRRVAVHETAHQWFYAMVGDSQALHPWLDEAFASYAEHLVDGTSEPASALQSQGRVDSSTESYGPDVNRYYFVTYDKGAAAIEAARRAAGPGAFDAALRCYVNANAWQIANPPDLARALAHLPAAVRMLQDAGALG
ncbi:MAG: peptidase M1 [Jatrophihabitans sp.]|nr:MAG: peptidase M1 [Jatrophihabitans sp.]